MNVSYLIFMYAKTESWIQSLKRELVNKVI